MTDDERRLLDKVVDQYLSSDTITAVQSKKVLSVIDDISKLKDSRAPNMIQVTSIGADPVFTMSWTFEDRHLFSCVHADGSSESRCIMKESTK